MSDKDILLSQVFAAEEHPSLAFALGDVVLAWQLAETQMTLLFSALAGIPANKASRLFVKFTNFRAKVQTLYTLIGLCPEYNSTLLHVQKLSKLSKTRNLYVHGEYLVQDRSDIGHITLIDKDAPYSHNRRAIRTKPHDLIHHATTVRAVVYDLILTLEGLECYTENIEDDAYD